MRYFAIYNENNELFAVGTGEDGVEISKEEYDVLYAEIHEKINLTEKLYNGEITLENVPEKWRDELERRVNDRIAVEGNADEQEISSDEALNIILGV